MNAPEGFDVEGWLGVADVLECSESTARRIETTEDDPPPIYRWRQRVYARSSELRAWRRQRIASGARR